MRLATLTAIACAAALAPAGTLSAAPPPPALALPLACEPGKTCEIQNYVDRDAGPGAMDYRCAHRTYDKHDGVDIRLLDMAAQRAGVDVLAAAAGRVVAIRDGVPDISIRAAGAPSVAGHECGNRVAIGLGGGWIIDYCHLARGSVVVKAGDAVAVGQRLGRVGLSGETEFPHLHFSVRRNDAVVDPFAPEPVTPGACAAQTGLWTPEAARALAYRRGAVLNTGFSDGLAAAESIEQRTVAPPTPSSGVVAYARLIGLEAGDVVELALTGPDGKLLARNALPPLDHDKAQWIAQVGRKQAPPGGWPHGAYRAQVEVRRAGGVAITRRWETTL